jgi:hypothetical protein
MVSVSEGGADITLDGRRIEISDAPLYLDVGHHVLAAALGGKHARAEFDAAAGSSGPIELKLVEDAGPPPVTGPPLPPPLPIEQPKKSVVPVIAGFSAVAVGFGVGVIGVAASDSASSDVGSLSKKLAPHGTSACYFTPAPADCGALKSAFKREGTWRGVAITSFVVGGAALIGTFVYIAIPAKSDVAPTVGVSAGHLSLSGRF